MVRSGSDHPSHVSDRIQKLRPAMLRLPLKVDLQGANFQGIPAKGTGKCTLKVEGKCKFRVFFGVFSGTSEYFQGLCPYPLCKYLLCTLQQVLNLTPLNPTPATCHKRKRKLHCNFWSAALQELHCNIVFSAVRKSFGPKAALQQTKNCTATSKKLRCRKVALSCRFPAAFKPPRLGTHVSDLLNPSNLSPVVSNLVVCNFYQKKRDVHKISARNSGAGNGCASFMGAWHFLVLSAGKPPCP